MLVWLLVCAAAGGWALAGWLWVAKRRHQCPIEPPTYAVLLNSAGLPESCRSLRTHPPATYSRPHGRLPATLYERVGTAALYRATAPRQPQ